MLKLDFVLNKKLLAAHTLQNTSPARFSEEDKDIVAFQNFVWEMNKDTYNYLKQGPDPISAGTTGEVVNKAREAEELLEKIIQIPEFVVLQEKTEESLTEVKKEWEQNLEISSKEMESILGFEPDIELTVYITHPHLLSGTNTGHGILWTHRSDWPNYNTVYLWHEALHSLIGNENLGHAVIELAADNELRARLNGGSYPPFQGHSYLEPLKRGLLTSWKEYLKQESRNIEVFIANHRKS